MLQAIQETVDGLAGLRTERAALIRQIRDLQYELAGCRGTTQHAAVVERLTAVHAELDRVKLSIKTTNDTISLMHWHPDIQHADLRRAWTFIGIVKKHVSRADYRAWQAAAIAASDNGLPHSSGEPARRGCGVNRIAAISIHDDVADAYQGLLDAFETLGAFDPEDPRSLLAAAARVAEACEVLATIIVARSPDAKLRGYTPASLRWDARLLRHSIEWWKRAAKTHIGPEDPAPPPSAIAFLLVTQAEDLLTGGYTMPSGAAVRAAIELYLEEACKRLSCEVLTRNGKVPSPPMTNDFINSLHRCGHITMEVGSRIKKAVRVGSACAHGCIPCKDKVRDMIACVRECLPFAGEDWVLHPDWTLDPVPGVPGRWTPLADVEQECIDETARRMLAAAVK